VTDIPGTTRDHIDVHLALEGVPLCITDTAGLRASDDAVERIGVDRAEALMGIADVLLWLGESGQAPEHPRPILVHSKSDLAGREEAPTGSLAVSATTGDGLSALVQAIVNESREILPAEGQLALNRRQADSMAEAEDALRSASASAELVLVAESLRLASNAFDRLTGRAGVEDLLDALFGRFCLGK
jgi:tRNA modification GTPase